MADAPQLQHYHFVVLPSLRRSDFVPRTSRSYIILQQTPRVRAVTVPDVTPDESQTLFKIEVDHEVR